MASAASPFFDFASPVHPILVTNSCPNSSGTASTASITIQNICSMVPIMRTTTNYLTWGALFAPIFRRYNLTGIVDGSIETLPKVLQDAFVNQILNPAYITWYENDQNILIWINSTFSESLIPYIVGINSSREPWFKLESRLVAASQSHIHELRSRLRNISKVESTATFYLQQIEEIANAFASAGVPVEDSDLISVTLHSLPPEYDSFVDAIQFHLGSITIDELHGLLLSKEIQLANRKKTTISSGVFQAFTLNLSSSTGILPTLTSHSGSQAFLAQNSSYFNQYQGRSQDRNQSHTRFS